MGGGGLLHVRERGYAGECVYETENGAEARQVMLLEGRATCQFLGSIVCGTFIPGGTWKPSPLCGGADEAAAGEAAVDSGADEDTDADEGTDAGAQAGDNPSEGGAACPPEGFDAVADLNLTAWAEAPWYPLAQMPLAYQGVETFFCVRASYKILDESTVQVQNTAEEEDGTPSPGDDSPFQFLRAVVQDPKEPAKLAVGPPSLPPEMYGSYWVVAAGSASQEGNGTDASFTLSDGPPEGPFDWGIVSGGAPKDPSPAARPRPCAPPWRPRPAPSASGRAPSSPSGRGRTPPASTPPCSPPPRGRWTEPRARPSSCIFFPPPQYVMSFHPIPYFA